VASRLGLSCRFRILGAGDARHPYVAAPDVEVVPIRWRHLVMRRQNHLSVLRSCDVVCDIGGGDSFTDLYGLRRFAMQWTEKQLALATGRPLILSPQTIGPFRRGWARVLAARVLRRCRQVVVRDRLSLDFVLELAPESTVIEATDVAVRLPYQPQPRAVDGRVRIGINVSGLLFNGGYTQDNMFELKADYPELVRTLVRRFAAVADAEIHLVSHVISERFVVEDDFRVSEALAGEFPGVILTPRFHGPSAAKSYISGLDFFCGARMHACIAAFSSGVPTVPIAYSRKFTGLFHSLGYAAIADCRTQSTAEAAETVLAAFADREHLRGLVAAGNTAAAGRLAAYEAALAKTLADVAGRSR
ncbi:MAG: polysaccharide pyruvyl transferase family protein, partial [Rhodospirillales bacterium]|nr:polysaccharide pyruvyl transferase family protein [Rhodospirillales bacterium]